MDRVAEPELMDTPDQARAYAEADFAAPHDRFVELFRECFPDNDLNGSAVIDLGCGPADVTLRFARRFPYCSITGIDAGPNMLALAREAIAQAGLGHRISLVQGYLPEHPLAPTSCDAVISNSLLHHLANPMALWRTIRRCAKPGALVFVMDLMRPVDAVRLDSLVDSYTRGEPEILRQDFRNSLKASYLAEEVTRQIGEAGLARLTVRVVSDRHWIAFGRLD